MTATTSLGHVRTLRSQSANRELPPRARRTVLAYCRAVKTGSLRLVCMRWRDRVDQHLTGFHMRHTFDEVSLRTRLRAIMSMLPRCESLLRLQLRDMADVDDVRAHPVSLMR